MNQHAIVLDDDEAFLRFITFSLAKGNFMVTPVTTGRELLSLLQSKQPDIVLLDRLLPDTNGFILCEEIKTRYPNIPVLMFSTAGDAKDVVAGLKLGADDYLPKPFSVDVLLAKVEAICRRYQVTNPSPSAVYKIGKLSIDEKSHLVTLQGDRLDLTKTEYELLRLLAMNPGRLYERKDILAKTLGYTDHSEHMESNIRFHINAVRKKLGRYRDYIETVRGYGYRFRNL